MLSNFSQKEYKLNDKKHIYLKILRITSTHKPNAVRQGRSNQGIDDGQDLDL